MIDFHDFKKALMGKIIFNGCRFIWAKFHGQIFIKIHTLQLIYYNYDYIC